MDRSGHRTIQPQDQAKSKLNGPENLALSRTIQLDEEKFLKAFELIGDA
jgi:hypothetical protein